MRRSLVTVVGALALGPIGLLGGCGIFGGSFDPHADDVEAARAAAAPTVRGVLDAVVAGRVVRGTFADDACREGQNNWKVHDGYDRSCSYALGAVVDGADTLDGVGGDLLAVEQHVLALGCTPRSPGSTLTAVAARYWQQFRSRPGYGPDDLPGAVYSCPDGVGVSVDPSTPDSPTLDNAAHIGFWTDREAVSEQRLSGARLLAVRAAPVASTFVVKVSKGYFVA